MRAGASGEETLHSVAADQGETETGIDGWCVLMAEEFDLADRDVREFFRFRREMELLGGSVSELTDEALAREATMLGAIILGPSNSLSICDPRHFADPWHKVLAAAMRLFAERPITRTFGPFGPDEIMCIARICESVPLCTGNPNPLLMEMADCALEKIIGRPGQAGTRH